MKNFLTLCLILLASPFAFAQNASKAKQFLKEKKFDEAAKSIEAAIADPKQSTKAETWYTRADVYVSMLEEKDEDVRNQEPKSLDFIAESLEKVKELEKGKGKFTSLIEISIPGVSVSMNDRIFNALYNAAIDNQGEPEVAFGYFEKLYKLYPDNFYVGRYLPRFAFYAEEDKKAVDYAQKFISNPKFADSLNVMNEIYQFGIMSAERSGDKDLSKSMIADAMKKFPKEPFFLNRLINILINEKKYEEAVNYLKTGLELAKENNIRAMYLSNLGLLSLDLKKTDDAVNYFEETIKLDEKNFNAFFYLGAHYFNQGAEIENTLTASELKPDSPKMKQVKEKYEKAMPYLEKAHLLDDKKTMVYHPLLTVYKTVYGNGHEKTKVMQAKIAALAGDDD